MWTAKSTSRISAGIAALLVASITLRAEDPKPPKAEDIIAKHVEACGGKAAIEKIKNREMKGTVDLPMGAGKGTITLYLAAPDKMYMTLKIGEMGRLERGCDGKAAWEMNQMNGVDTARTLEGDEGDDVRRNAMMDRWIRWKDLYAGVDSVTDAKVDDKPAWKVVLKTKNKGSETCYFDQNSGLLLRQDRTRKNPQTDEDMPLEYYFQDYKKVDDLLIAHKAVLKFVIGPQKIEQTTAWESIKHNVELPADRFEVPKAVKESKGAGSPPSK